MNVHYVNKRGACKGTHTVTRHAENILIMTFRDYHFMHISLMRVFQDQGESKSRQAVLTRTAEIAA